MDTPKDSLPTHIGLSVITVSGPGPRYYCSQSKSSLSEVSWTFDRFQHGRIASMQRTDRPWCPPREQSSVWRRYVCATYDLNLIKLQSFAGNYGTALSRICFWQPKCCFCQARGLEYINKVEPTGSCVLFPRIPLDRWHDILPHSNGGYIR